MSIPLVKRMIWFGGIVAILALATVALTTTRLVAQNTPGSAINSCKHDRTGVLRIVEENESCPGGWTALSWNSQGPQGDAGPQGPQGAQGPSGEAVTTTLFTSTGTGEIILSSANRWNEFPGLTRDITLAEDSLVMAYYQVTMGGSNTHLVTRLNIDGEEDITSRAIEGDTAYWSPSNVWVGQLPAGSHSIKVEYRTPAGGSNNPGGNDWNNRVLKVMVFNSN
jgi:hypothetical protein